MMPRKEDPLQSLLQTADRKLQANATSVRPIAIADLQRRSGRRQFRRHLTTAVVVVVGVSLVLVWSRGRKIEGPSAGSTKLAADPTSGSPHVTPSDALMAPVTERSLAALQREAAAVLKTAKALEHDLRRDELRKEYRALLRRSPLVDPRSTTERAAQFRLHLAAELGRQSGTTELALREYREIVEHFPETSSAVTAQQRLAAARSDS